EAPGDRNVESPDPDPRREQEEDRDEKERDEGSGDREREEPPRGRPPAEGDRRDLVRQRAVGVVSVEHGRWPSSSGAKSGGLLVHPVPVTLGVSNADAGS